MKAVDEENPVGIDLEVAERLQNLPPYLFAEIDKVKRRLISEGKDVINLGIGDPDLPTPDHIIEALYAAAKDPSNHQYAMDAGMPELRQAIVDFYMKRFGVTLDPNTEVLPLIGSKEGICHMPLAYINQGDYVLIPEPGYPGYQSATILAGGESYFMPLLEKNGYLPDFDLIDSQVSKKTKLMFLNYPHNPTGAVCEANFFDKVVEYAKEHNTLICHDAAYTEMSYDGYKAPSFLQAEGAKDVGIEFHSLSKTYNMTGWRIGFAVGNAKAIAALGKVKANIDSGIFQAVQLAGVAALNGPQEPIEKNFDIYKERRDILIDSLNEMGWKVQKAHATFYVWIPVPPGYTSSELTTALLEKAHIVTTPGNGFGPSGEGYIRMALTVPKERLLEAVNRIKEMHS